VFGSDGKKQGLADGVDTFPLQVANISYKDLKEKKN